VIVRSIREALVLLGLAALFGFSYSLITQRGLFASKAVPPGGPTGQIEMIDLAAARRAFEQGTAVFIDSRHAFEFRQGHIPHALSIPLNEFDQVFPHLTGIPATQSIIVYCDGTECNSSMDVGVRLMQAGYHNVRVFFGGWQEWSQQGLPSEAVKP